MKYVVGVDCGTTNVKSVLFDESGSEVLVKSQSNNPHFFGKSMAEMDMYILWEKVSLCIKELVEDGPASKEEICAVGITGQGEGLWMIDAKGNPVQEAILWCDGRATQEVHDARVENPEVGRLMYSITGTPPLAGTQLMLLKWMHNNRKDVLDKAAACFFCKDWVRYKLSGDIHTDWSDAGTSLLDLSEGKHVRRLFDALDLGPYVEKLASPLKTDDIAAEISPSAAKETGLMAGTPIVTGGIDVCVSTLGTGAINERDCCVILGTTCATNIVLGREKCTFGVEGTRYEKHPLNDLFIYLQATMNGTPNIDWMMDQVVGTKDFNIIQDMIASEEPGSNGVIYTPYISTAGERAPFYNPNARAGFFGMDINTKKSTLVRSVFEGVSFSIRDCIEGIGGDMTIYLAGGGTNSAIWAQMITDILGMKVLVPDVKELGAKGICIMALVKTGFFKTYREAVDSVCKFSAEYLPDQKNKDRYDHAFKLYKEIREASMTLWDHRNSYLEKVSNG